MNIIPLVASLIYKTLHKTRRQNLPEKAGADKKELQLAKIIYLYQKKVIMPQPGKVISMFTKNDSHHLSIHHL